MFEVNLGFYVNNVCGTDQITDILISPFGAVIKRTVELKTLGALSVVVEYNHDGFQAQA